MCVSSNILLHMYNIDIYMYMYMYVQLTSGAKWVWHREGEGGEEDDLQHVQEEVVHVQPSSKLEPLLIEESDDQRMLQQSLTLVLCLEKQHHRGTTYVHVGTDSHTHTHTHIHVHVHHVKYLKPSESVM